MDATEVIDSYVHDVARRLPPGKRNDVAFELRALLADDLQARAGAEGRSPDHEMAVVMVREFGRPAAVAVRYYRPFTIIEPSDTWSFLVAAVVGGTLAGLLVSLGHGPVPYHVSAQRANVALLAWLGVLVVVFGVKNLILRYRSNAFAWTPRPVRDSDSASRAGAVGLALVWLALLACYVVPGRIAELVSGGRVAAGTLAYSGSFTSGWRMPWLTGLLAIAAGLQLVVAVQGRWRPGTRWVRIAVTALVSIQLGWHASYGAIFEDPRTERLGVPTFAWLSGVILIGCGILLYREYSRVHPAPTSA
jgi:hypothetical protein